MPINTNYLKTLRVRLLNQMHVHNAESSVGTLTGYFFSDLKIFSPLIKGVSPLKAH